MRRALLTILLILALAANAGCAMKAFKSKKYWIETGVVAAAASADGVTTSQALKRCPTCTEINPFLGRRPSNAELFWKGFTFHATKRLLIALIWQKSPDAGNALSTADTVFSTTFHATLAWKNTKIKSECEQSGLRCPD